MQKDFSNKNYKVLIVDDIIANVEVLTTTLKLKGIDSKTELSGYAGIATAKKYLPDLIILDILMPELNGFETCKILKETTETQDIPVIFLTAYNQTSDIVKGFEVGAVDYIKKPFNTKEVIVRAITHLELKRLRDNEKKHIETIEKYNNSLKKEIFLKKKFLSIISHDLKNSLSDISNFSDLLCSFVEKQNINKTKQYAKIISNSSYQITQLLENLLEWSRLQKEKFVIEKTEIQLIELVNRTIDLIKIQANKKNIQIEKTVNSNIKIFADSHLIYTVLRNLISNSIKFTPKNGSIKIEAEEKNFFVEIKITDTGIGINKENQKEIFKEGVFLTTNGTDNEEGSGIGLNLCKEFVEKSGGKIQVNSELDKGSVFSFTIPKQ